MAVVFSNSDKKQISAWIGGNKDYTLLFKASTHGCNAQAFHTRCDYQGPTITLCYNIDNCVFGGYNPLSWNSSGEWTTDKNAFLFRLKFKGTSSPKKYPIKANNDNGMLNDSSYGPVFGSGHDLSLFDTYTDKTENYFQGDTTCDFGTSYEAYGESFDEITNNNCYLDIEVYGVSDAPKELERPWRKMPEVSVKSLKTDLEKYCPPDNTKVPFVNILLIGQIGAGKSSFFNTVNSVFKGEITSKARSGTAEHSLTTTFRMYQIKSETSGKPLKFRLCDTRGLEEDRSLDLVDLVAIIEGHVSDRFQFNPSVSITPKSPGYIKSPTMADQMHCIAFVVDGSSVDMMPKHIIELWKNLQKRANNYGLPQVVILTKVDKVCPLVNEDVSKIYLSKALEDMTEKASELMAVPRNHVFPVKNYEKEVEMDENVDLSTLICIKRMLRFVDDYLEDNLDEA